MNPNELVSYIFGGAAFGFPALFGGWLDSAPAFHAFAETHRDKIRKKARLVRDPETRCDLQAELAVAYWLCQDRRLALEYEAYAAGKGRGPDFTATFRTNTRFNVEVTRLRPGSADQPIGPGYPVQKIVTNLCAKLPQLPPGLVNILALVTEDAAYEAHSLQTAAEELAGRAAHDDGGFFARYGFTGAPDFRRQFARLSAAVLRGGPTCGVYGPAGLWRNPAARHPLPAALATLLGR